MQTSSDEFEWDALDHWIGWALRAGVENARPSEQVWQRIVRHVMNSAGPEQATVPVEGADQLAAGRPSQPQEPSTAVRLAAGGRRPEYAGSRVEGGGDMQLRTI